MQTARVLDQAPVRSLGEYTDAGGGCGLQAALKLEPPAVLEDLAASGLRGRGGAGFPTATKWAAVAERATEAEPATVVVNAAEGEPGSFKDRAILRANPYRVLEGALVAAAAVGADTITVALKEGFDHERAAVETAIGEIAAEGWDTGVTVAVVTGPSHYLLGEETGLLEALDGRDPFPRIAPPYRHGVEAVGSEAASSAAVTMAAEDELTASPPTLVNNVETLANVPGILDHGPAWFRELGTDGTPGTFVCTVTGATRTHGVAEFPGGTSLTEVIEEIGDGPTRGRTLTAAMSGVANPLLPADRMAVGLDYEAFASAGSGLGAAGFIVFDDDTDLLAVAAGVARFLAVESCGQCRPCKDDGLKIMDRLDRLSRSNGSTRDVETVSQCLTTVADGARCYLATQQQRVVTSVLELFPDAVTRHVDGDAPPTAPEFIAPIVDMVDGRAVLDDRQGDKQPDWTHGETWSGQWPAEARDQRARG
jgi:NADH:ubiquinone oxidoreductase subunit F (NADH-binding)